MRSVLAGIVLLASGCGTVTVPQYRAWSAEATGCPPAEITISHEKSVIWAGQSIDWVAQCRGLKFACTNAGSTACTESADQYATAAGPSAAGATSAVVP